MKFFCLAASIFAMFNLHADFFINPNNLPLVDKVLGPDGNYFGITINGKQYKGGRIWSERWNIIKDAYDYRGLKVLDLGCFLGINSICIKKYGGAKSVVGVDHDFLDQAALLARAFEVDIKFIKVDFDCTIDYEKLIGFDYDLVFCLSLFHWIRDKDRFLSYLSKFKQIIYEGHQTADVEIARFKNLGFEAEILGTTYSGIHQMTEQGRTIILFYK